MNPIIFKFKPLFSLAFILICTVSCLDIFNKNAPDDVTNLSLASSESQVTLSWTDPLNWDFKEIEINYDDTMIYIPKGVETVIISNLNNFREYKFIVYSNDKKGNISQGISIMGTPFIDLNKCIGKYNFTTIDWKLTVNINGPIISTVESDTTKYIGTIEKIAIDELKISFKPEPKLYFWSGDTILMDGLAYLKVSDSSRLYYPDNQYGLDRFEGKLIPNDSIFFTYEGHMGHAGSFYYKIFGKKVNE